MQIRPILSSLTKHLVPTCLIVVQIALTCAVLCNAIFMIGQRFTQIHLADSIDEAAISVITIKGIDPSRAASDVPRNIESLQKIAGVRAASAFNSLPLTANSWVSGFSTSPASADRDAVNAAVYMMANNGDQAVGFKLLAGRFFAPDEYINVSVDNNHSPTAHVVLVTKSFAARMWPNTSALGKLLYLGQNSYTVVGVVADVLAPALDGDNEPQHYAALIFPSEPSGALSYYVVRSSSQDIDHVTQEATKIMATLNPDAIVQGKTFQTIRETYFSMQSSMIWVLTIVCAVMLTITGFGIVGLTSFWVQQRRRQIGVRRALGATRTDILSYFCAENFVIVSAGIFLGMAFAYAINLYLIQSYELARLPWYYLPCASFVLWAVGQIAVLGPALRAATVEPSIAIRNN